MTRFLAMWEMDTSKMPADPEQAMKLSMRLTEMIKAALKEGRLKDWGEYPSGNAGYVVFEGTEQEGHLMAMQFSPYVKALAIHPVLTVEQVEEDTKKLAEMRRP